MRAALALAAMMTLAASGVSQAYYFNGNKLNELCQADRTYVAAYISGAADAFTTDFSGETKRICLPLTITRSQLTNSYCKYLSENPEKRDLPGNVLAYQVLLNLYRCPN